MTEPSPWTDPVLHLDVLVVAGAAATYSCLAIWAGLSHRHWFLRAAALLGSIALLYPIQGDEPMLMLLVALPAIAVTAPLVERWFVSTPADERVPALQRTIRFGLVDLFLATGLIGCAVAICLTVVRKELPINWLDIAFTSVVTAVVAALSLAGALTRGRARALVLAVHVVCLTIGSWVLTRGFEWHSMHLAPATNNTSYGLRDMLGETDLTYWGAEFLLLLETSVLIAWAAILGIRRTSAVRPPDRGFGRWRRRIVRGAGVLVVAGLMCLLVTIYALAVPMMSRPDDRFTEPNSYPRLLAVAKEIEALNPNSQSIEQLQAGTQNDNNLARIEQLQAAYQEVYRLAKLPGHVPLKWNKSDLDLTTHWAIRALARCLFAEAQSAAKARRFDETVDNALACTRAGNISCRGGLLTHWLHGTAIENMGVWALVEVHQGISAEQAAHLLKELQFIEGGREPISRINTRDAVWHQKMGRWAFCVSEAILRLLGKPGWNTGLSEFAQQQRDTTHRLLVTELALRLFRNEYDRLPVALNELVPAYIGAIPIDPYSSVGQPLVYQVTTEGYRLYSVGPDGRDDGGRFGAWSDRFNRDRPIDIDLETLIR